MTGWRSILFNFQVWADLMGSTYENYALLPEDDPYQECLEWFWTSINLDETYPREFLEDLRQIVEDIDAGKVKTYSTDEVMDQLKHKLDYEKWEDDDFHQRYK